MKRQKKKKKKKEKEKTKIIMRVFAARSLPATTLLGLRGSAIGVVPSRMFASSKASPVASDGESASKRRQGRSKRNGGPLVTVPIPKKKEGAAEKEKEKKEKKAASKEKGLESSQRAKKYMQEYYARNREKMLEKNQANRKAKVSLAREGIYTTGKKGRPQKKRADVDHDDDEMLSPEELQREIERHEKAHAEWLKEVEENRAELLRMYEEEEGDGAMGTGVAAEEEDASGPMTVQDVVRVLRSHQAKDVATLDLRHKTDMCDYKVIVTGTSAAHSRALTDAVFMAFKRRKAFHSMPRVEGRTNAEWCLIDCGFLMVHIFSEATRRKYNLESLWGLRPSSEELAATLDYDWEDSLFPEFSQAVYEAEEDDDD